jgi:hypothetical protein
MLTISAEEFNRLFPVGTRVRFYPVAGRPEYEQTVTRSEAWELGHGQPVVKVQGRAGGVGLAWLELSEIAEARERLEDNALKFDLEVRCPEPM